MCLSSSYYEWLREQFSNKRAVLEEGLISADLEPIASHGGFFLMAKLPYYKFIDKSSNLNEPYDYKFCRYLAKEYGVLGIPASPFFSSTGRSFDGGKSSLARSPMARFAFCKKNKTILEASLRLKQNVNLNNDLS